VVIWMMTDSVAMTKGLVSLGLANHHAKDECGPYLGQDNTSVWRALTNKVDLLIIVGNKQNIGGWLSSSVWVGEVPPPARYVFDSEIRVHKGESFEQILVSLKTYGHSLHKTTVIGVAPQGKKKKGAVKVVNGAVVSDPPPNSAEPKRKKGKKQAAVKATGAPSMALTGEPRAKPKKGKKQKQPKADGPSGVQNVEAKGNGQHGLYDPDDMDELVKAPKQRKQVTVPVPAGNGTIDSKKKKKQQPRVATESDRTISKVLKKEGEKEGKFATFQHLFTYAAGANDWRAVMDADWSKGLRKRVIRWVNETHPPKFPRVSDRKSRANTFLAQLNPPLEPIKKADIKVLA